jgi:adenosylmethionine---8-amino-7-oxononanoate aminotransferase
MKAKQSNAIWYPFTQMKTAQESIHIERAKDALLYTKDGREYIDAISSWWVNIHGHAHPQIAEAIAAQAYKLEQVIFAGFTHSPAIELADNLISILPHQFAKVFFSDNGSTSVEVAIKLALQFWHNQGFRYKTKIIAFENSYHGDTFGAMSVGAKSIFNAAFEQHLFAVNYIPVPNEQNIESVKEQLRNLIKEDNTTAFIFEPLVQGAGGMLMHSPEHLSELIKIAQNKAVICIADEVMTGFGRTGKNFAMDYLNHKPDIVCLSKGITGGFMPLGVTACTQQIFDTFYSTETTKTFFHGHSYTANPLACAAANASINLLLSDNCRKQISMIVQAHSEFADKIRTHAYANKIRQTGTIIAIELKTEEITSYFNSIRNQLYEFCMERGVLLRPLGNILYVMPPYCITHVQLEKIYHTIIELLNYLEKTYGKPD